MGEDPLLKSDKPTVTLEALKNGKIRANSSAWARRWSSCRTRAGGSRARCIFFRKPRLDCPREFDDFDDV